MDTLPTIYSPEKQKERIFLTQQQKDAVRQITMGIDVVDEAVRSMAVEDVIRTLENGHPLNRIITGTGGQTLGYIACEDFVPHEAYIKYFGTAGIGQTGRSPRQEISAFLDYAKQQGYTKINFHGWNDRLNRALEHYGFRRLRTDNMADFSVDFYEKSLAEEKPQTPVDEERARAFEQKYINELNRQYQEILAGFSQKQKKEGGQTDRQKKEKTIAEAFEALSGRLAATSGFKWGDRQKAVLKLKLARHFQQNETWDANVLYDAIIESPKFINTDKGSLHRLLEVHEQKTLQKTAEIRKRRAEMTGQEAFNPYENLFTTESGKYYMARLLNMPHLEEESQYMSHCVGTSDSYVNRMKRGEVEILSFRRAPKISSKTQKLEGDEPVLTLEYNLKTGVIEQIKKANDEYLRPSDPFISDVFDALKRLRETKTDAGELRAFSRVNSSELGNFPVKDYHLLTDVGEVHFREFNPDQGHFILKAGSMAITPDISQSDAVKLLRIFARLNFQPEEVARKPSQINSRTTAYVGKLEPGIFDLLQKYDIAHIYTSFPESRIRREELGIGGKTAKALEQELDSQGIKMNDDYSRFMLRHRDFTTLKNPEQIELIRLKVRDLFSDEQVHTTDEIYKRAEKLGLELCPAEVGPHYRLKYQDQPLGEWLRIAMKPIPVRSGLPHVFNLERLEDGPWLSSNWASPDDGWSPGRGFVFSLRKRNLKS